MNRVLTPNAKVLLTRLCEIAQQGPLPSIGHGTTAIGMTLLDALGIQYKSTAKPDFLGIVVNARRGLSITSGHRVNLFARVPDWRLSACKSSEEIAKQYGYKAGRNVWKLYCTVRAGRPNPQGLFLAIDHRHQTLDERAQKSDCSVDVARWALSDLRKRLLATHPESMWVIATVFKKGGSEAFHFRRASYTGGANAERLEVLLGEGTITVDHLIDITDGRTREKGPLFKIAPGNIEMLFPAPLTYDLMKTNPTLFAK